LVFGFINFQNGRKILTLLTSGCPTHHLNAIFKTGTRSTNVVLAGDLVLAGTMLVTLALDGSISLKFLLETRLQSKSFDTLDDLLGFLFRKL